MFLIRLLMLLVAVFSWSRLAGSAAAQDSSLLIRDMTSSNQPMLTLESSSVFYQKPEPPPNLGLHDTLTVIVNISTVMQSEGDIESRKKVKLTSVLSDWIRLDLRTPSLFPDPQERGDPKVAGQYDSQFRAESDMESRDNMTFTMAAEVVDIRPNGNLVIEGRQTVYHNSEQWTLYLAGEVHRRDIDSTNTVTSDKIINLDIRKSERGQVRDGYRRGWFQRFFDRFQPI